MHGLIVLGSLCVAALVALPRQAEAKPNLRFSEAGRFKIVQFSDIQDCHNLDPRTSAAMAKILDVEKPDLVVLSGDTVSTGECANLEQLKTAIAKLSQPMESRRIPWVTVFGNHDVDGLGKIGITKAQMFALYRACPTNVNPPDPKGVYGSGNGLLPVIGSRAGKLAFGVWLLDSNAYAPANVGGQRLGGYDWIHADQIAWYEQTSRAAERQIGKKLPALMFFHIPLPEFGALAASRPLTGERNEPECPANLNSGLFTSVLGRGDVLGIYVGHDHTNTYEGTWYGLRLGYGGNIGYHTYGLGGDTEEKRNRLRGARVFIVDERHPEKYETRYVCAAQL